MGLIEALYIFDEHNDELLDHVYTGRPASAPQLIRQYLLHPSPRPSLIYLPNTRPPTCLFSLLHNRLLFLCPTSGDTEPLLALEFLHRIADTLEDFLGAPLLAPKIEANYDVVVQIVNEMCDSGIVCNTEPDALREVVEMPSWVGSILGGFGLPTSAPSLVASRSPGSSLQSSSPFLSSSSQTNTSSSGSAIPWRRANVRHTSNELYVDIIEKLSVVIAPSGRPISAFANGAIAFNSKLSGVPDLILNLTAPGGRDGVHRAMGLPCFHPCVRLARWRDSPGELSFIPPDGKFVLAAYECDLLPDIFSSESDSGKIPNSNLQLPVTLELNTSVGTNGDEFEARLLMKAKWGVGSSISSDFASSRTPDNASKFSRAGLAFNSLQNSAGLAFNSLQNSAGPAFSGPQSSGGTSASPTIDEILVTIPTRASIRDIVDMRASVGEVQHLASEGIIEWRISGRQATTAGRDGAVLRCTFLGASNDRLADESATNGLVFQTIDNYEYDENGQNDSYQIKPNGVEENLRTGEGNRNARQQAQQQPGLFMPQSATLSFGVKGWLPSGIKVDSMKVNTKTSKGLGAGVTPYKGVKYHTISQDGIEVRC